MKHTNFLLLLPMTMISMEASAFVPPMRIKQPLSSAQMSDFASSMPEQTLEDKLNNSADNFISDMKRSLGENTPPPVELEVLEKAREDGAGPSEIAVRTYELLIEQGMLYDIDENKILTPTQFNIKENLEVPEVKSEFLRLYKYGMVLIQKRLIDIDVCKNIVQERLIKRTGLTPEEFDKWLGF